MGDNPVLRQKNNLQQTNEIIDSVRPNISATTDNHTDHVKITAAYAGWQQELARLDTAHQEFAADIMAVPNFTALMNFLIRHSNYLSERWLTEPEFVLSLFAQGPDAMAAQIHQELTQKLAHNQVERSENMRLLRRAKGQMALLIAVADICDYWPLERVTLALSDFAELSITLAAQQIALAMQFPQATASPKENTEENATATNGLIILGMGKLGGRELNYSSDIDLIILFDPERVPPAMMALCGRKTLGELYIALARELVKILADVTEDGYVFRTDLRLRPDPASTPLALSIRAAEIYYESVGQNWERAAMIKARPVGGDIAAGQAFLRGLTPFIWRKHLDFAAIADIFSIRRQINNRLKPRHIQNPHQGANLRPDENYYAEFVGYNLKLGQGGIREIEFFAQTQQLVWGGRLAHLRESRTIAALGELVKAKLCDESSATMLSEAYYFLRRAEHRLQMIDDQQTQTLPSDPTDLENFAQFMGFDNFTGFAEALKTHLSQVIAVGSKFFENNTSLSDPSGGNLVFTGTDNDPDTLATLSNLGYDKAAQIADTIRGWHHGRIRATRTTRAREILTELTPTILNSLAQTPEPDTSFARFDRFLTSLPSGVDFFSLLRANPHLLELLAVIMGAAPILAEQLSDMPSLLDCLVMAGGDFSANLMPSNSEIGSDLRHYVADITHYEDFLDRVRRWSAERRFQLGLALLQRDLDTQTASHLLSRQADEVISVMIERVAPYVLGKNPNNQSNSTQSEPSPPNFAVIGYGKLGARELTLESDLDLVFVFDAENASSETAPQLPTGFHTKFCQRLIAALTTQTANGGLYRIDMRLRPDGEKGGIVTHFDGFADYHRHNAWVFERMAMTRARVVYAPPDLRMKIEAMLLECLTRPAPSEKIQQDVSDMRRMIAEQHQPRHFLDLKYLQGGLIDIEFMTQFWLLSHAEAARPIFAEWLRQGRENSAPPLSPPNQSATRHALNGLRNLGIIGTETAENFIAAHNLFTQCQFLLRLCLGEGWRGDDADIPSSVKSVLVHAANCPDWSHLLALIQDTCAEIKLACAKIS